MRLFSATCIFIFSGAINSFAAPKCPPPESDIMKAFNSCKAKRADLVNQANSACRVSIFDSKFKRMYIYDPNGNCLYNDEAIMGASSEGDNPETFSDNGSETISRETGDEDKSWKTPAGLFLLKKHAANRPGHPFILTGTGNAASRGITICRAAYTARTTLGSVCLKDNIGLSLLADSCLHFNHFDNGDCGGPSPPAAVSQPREGGGGSTVRRRNSR